MNKKEELLRGIVRIGVDCCVTRLDDGTFSISLEEVLGKHKTENVLMTRCIIVSLIRDLGFSIETIGELFHRTSPAVRNLIRSARQYHRQSYAYRLAEKEVEDKVKNDYGITKESDPRK